MGPRFEGVDPFRPVLYVAVCCQKSAVAEGPGFDGWTHLLPQTVLTTQKHGREGLR